MSNPMDQQPLASRSRTRHPVNAELAAALGKLQEATRFMYEADVRFEVAKLACKGVGAYDLEDEIDQLCTQSTNLTIRLTYLVSLLRERAIS